MNVEHAKINQNDGFFPIMEMEIDGRRYSLMVKDYPEKHWAWLCDRFTSNITAAYAQGREAGIKEVQEPIKKALNFLDKK